MKQTHRTAAAITAVSGRLYGDIGDLYKLLDYMTGDNLFTHQLPRASRACKPSLLKQFPWFSNYSFDGSVEAFVSECDNIIAKYGSRLEVEPLGSWESIDPLVEMSQMMERKS